MRLYDEVGERLECERTASLVLKRHESLHLLYSNLPKSNIPDRYCLFSVFFFKKKNKKTTKKHPPFLEYA